MKTATVKRARSAAAIAAAAMALLWTSAAAQADDAPVRALVKSMADFVATQQAISFDMETSLDVMTTDGQRLTLASTGAVELSRPDKIRAERKGGFADVAAVFDGKTLSLLGKNQNVYAQIETPGTLDQLVDTLRDKLGSPLPAADLLTGDVYKQLTSEAKEVMYLGPGVILGQMCEHVAMRAGELDLQLWIAQGDKPYPCRYTLTSRSVPGDPQYTVDIWNWKSSTAASTADFSFTPPAGATRVEPAGLTNMDELPSHLSPKN
ncbi:DUF2092 domain-containing protein [Aestuariivirga sp.]|uniref:DUF2092 domain-containing protein n=1 Tax=Aestuariivirga sp. TaxID=2650926 RepID=UPI003BABCE5A